ncbi:MAG: alpha/beta hydrolase [Planctomycetota bacterium]|jgi:alpha-beta hydrolase superfamily lysophospholipase
MEEQRRRGLWWLVSGLVGRVIRSLLYGIVGAVVVLIAGFVVLLEKRPDLSTWHTVHLDAEFTADGDVTDLAGYLALEERLFAQLDREVYGSAPDTGERANRFNRGSLADPQRWPVDWNRTIERRADEPRAGVLLLHGLSDSPYSMRTLAEAMHARGATVLCLRLPGHGTAPSGLVHVEWEDWAAAIVLAMRHLDQVTGDRPLYIAGYSNGGALAVEYALSALADDELPAIDGLLLLSPQIGVTKLAVLAAWQERLGHVLGLEKLSWNSIGVEFDPFKYESFALNAGKQSHRITTTIQSHVAALSAEDRGRFPPVLAFQSVVDATVSTTALVRAFFRHLPAARHELVAFDLNRSAGLETLFTRDPRAEVQSLLDDPSRNFRLTLITNRTLDAPAVVSRSAGPGETTVAEAGLDLSWPRELFSLSHIALPFPPDDPLYGGPEAAPSPGIQIGNAIVRGERGIFAIDPGSLMRIRWNPFHSYQQQRALAFLGLDEKEVADDSP